MLIPKKATIALMIVAVLSAGYAGMVFKNYLDNLKYVPEPITTLSR